LLEDTVAKVVTDVTVGTIFISDHTITMSLDTTVAFDIIVAFVIPFE
jgi:hypothetical protein